MSAIPVPSVPGYRDLEMFAHGSTAFVYRAVQERLERTVAVKILLLDDATTTAASVEKELETTVRVSNHPHIVSIIDTGTTGDGRPYIVMEYCEGGSYSSILKAHGAMAVEDVIDVGVKIGLALQAAHNAGILHRDVKPQNILRAQYGPALADFGIARAPETLAATEAINLLTPLHASPEALLREPQTAASDLYSLASSMWQMLAGYAPFADPGGATGRDDHLRRVLSDAPPPRLPRDDVPAWLENLLVRSLARDPNQRPPSCQAFADELQLGALSERLEARREAERTEVLPDSAATVPAPRFDIGRDSGPSAPFDPGSTERAAPFVPPPAPPGPVHPSRARRPRIRPEMYPMLAVVAIVIVVLLGVIGVVWAVGDADADPPSDPEALGSSESDDQAEQSEDEESPTATGLEVSDFEATASTITLRTDAAEGEHTCTAAAENTERRAEGDCGEITVDGLEAQTDYTVSLRVHDTGQEIVEVYTTDRVPAQVFWDCPLTRQYCADQNAEIGVGSDPERNDVIDTVESGTELYAYCYVETDTTITPRGDEAEGYWDYHPGKDASNLAIKVDFRGEVGYIPWVWIVIDSGELNDTDPLAPCLEG
ncbi:serine/threonine-protein kinase [Glycomyces salinus]|uniref:serine/threonine-protein kinase n=1 Tax=Glycomyces salinus TaxID=980294 RepID=UPI0018EE29E8|nr:serine/threonine-protein kinase [Glycomyces salinus]